MKIAHNSPGRVFAHAYIFRVLNYPVFFSSLSQPPAPSRDLDIEPSMLSLIKEWGGGASGGCFWDWA